MRPRKHSAPNRMSVQDRAGTHTARDGDVEQRFRRGPSISADDVDGIIHLQELRGCEAALVQTCRSNRQPQRLARNHRAEVSTRAQNPAARVETLSDLRQVLTNLREFACLWLHGLNTDERSGAVAGPPILHCKHYTNPSGRLQCST